MQTKIVEVCRMVVDCFIWKSGTISEAEYLTIKQINIALNDKC